MAFTGCPQAHDKAQAAFFQMALIRMGNDGRVEKGGRFNGVLHSKVCSDERLLNIAEHCIRWQIFLHHIQVPLKNVPDVFVPSGKIVIICAIKFWAAMSDMLRMR
jgi:hypothetical protein